MLRENIGNESPIMQEVYRLDIEPDGEGHSVGTCPDLPEVCVRARTELECLRKARRALSDAIEFRFEMFREIPTPTARGRTAVQLKRATATKLRLLWAITQQHVD